MKPLNEMTLLELAAAIGDSMHDESKRMLPFAAELQRRQRMLEAAERLYTKILEAADLSDAAVWFANEYAAAREALS